ncbi:hypothetical protein IAU60_003291 [Kwoniella sp. DSM 27419]
MPGTYLPHHLVHAHLPPPPTLPASIPELRVASDTAIPLTDEEYASPLHPDHAVSVVRCQSANLLLRSIYNGHVLELRPFSPTISSGRTSRQEGSETVRIFFPEQLRPLSEECITLSHRDQRLFISVVSLANNVHRLNFPLGNFRPDTDDRFVFSTKGNEEWHEEFAVPEDIVRSCAGVGAWTVLDENTVVLGGGDGGIVRLVRTGHWTPGDGEWEITHHRPPSRLRLPSLFSRSANTDERIISFARFEKGDHIPVIYTLSQDRKLRTWNAANGACLRSVDVRSSSQEMIVRSQAEASTSATTEDGSVNALRVVPHPSAASRYSHIVVAFAASRHSSASAGTFVAYRAATSSHSVNDLAIAGEKACSLASANAELRGFEVLPPVMVDGADNGWTLWATWDKKGVPFCESVAVDDIFQFTTYIETSDAVLLSEWQRAASPADVAGFDAAYFDNILSSEPPNPADPEDNGDIPAAFIQHLFHPGRFSQSTLNIALEDYIQQLSKYHRAQQSSVAYHSLSKKFGGIVGSHVEMEFSPQTGAPVVDAYRKKLKADWLGVWSNVRELDRQARWPVCTTVVYGEVAVLAREGISVPVLDDTASLVDRLGTSDIDCNDFLRLSEGALRTSYPALAPPKARASAIAVSMAGAQIASTLRGHDAEQGTGTALDQFVNTFMETVIGVTHEPPEAIAGGMWDDYIEPLLSEENIVSIRRILSESPEVSRALDEALDILEDTTFPSLATRMPESRWSGLGNSLISSAITCSIEARYNLARNVLLTSLFHLSESHDPSGEDEAGEHLIETLGRALTTFHRFRVLQWVTEQTGEEAKERGKLRKANKRKTNGGDDVLAEGVGNHRTREAEFDTSDGLDSDTFEIGYSLLHSLVSRQQSVAVTIGSGDRVAAASSAFLTSIALVSQGQTDVRPHAGDVQFGYKILVDGHAQLAGAFTDLYPLSAGLAYIKGRAYLECGMVDEAVRYLEKASSGCKDGSLEAMLAKTSGLNGLGHYYRHVCRLFDEQNADAPVVYFGQLAIQSSSEVAASTRDLWTKVFLASIALGRYEDAYSTLTSLPFMDLKRDFLGQLISVMCENSEVGRLNSLGFIGFQKDVEELLRFKARNSNPLRTPNYYKVLYSWHISRGDYRSAGEIMYLQGRRFAEGSSNMPAFELSAMQARSYLAAINALSLVDKRNAWVSVPGAPSRSLRGIKRRKVTSYIPEEEFSEKKRPVDIISLADIEMEYTLVLSQLKLSSQIPDAHDHGVTVSPQEVLGIFIQRGQFDVAQSAAASLKLDMTDFFRALAARCVELSRLSEHAGDFSAATFLQVSPVTARLRGSPNALAMMYLQSALTRHDSEKTNWRYRAIVADTLLELNKDKNTGWQMPVWLTQWEMKRDPEGWISRALRYGWVSEALDWTTELVRKASPPELLPRGKADVTDLPYNLIDRVLAAAEEDDEKDETHVQQKAKLLRSEIERRLKGLEAARR